MDLLQRKSEDLGHLAQCGTMGPIHMRKPISQNKAGILGLDLGHPLGVVSGYNYPFKHSRALARVVFTMSALSGGTIYNKNLLVIINLKSQAFKTHKELLN